MSNKGEDDAKIVNFESLELEEEDDASSQKLTELLAYLKENLEADKYTEVLEKLGVEQDLSNADLLKAFKELIAPKKPEDEEEEEDEEKKAAKEEDTEKPDRQAFMKECMAGGKSLEECTDEWKKKYPEPAKKEGKDDLKIPEEFKSLVKTLEDRITELEGQKELAEVSMDVEKLVSEKHLAPVQRDAVIKMSAKMPEEDRAEFLDFFRATQKIDVHRDAGRLPSDKPGEVAGLDIDPARKKALIRAHGLDGLIEDKADKTRLPWEMNN